jgi:ribosomal protein L31E
MNDMRTELSFTYPNCFACVATARFGTRVRFVKRVIKKGMINEEVELFNEDKKKLGDTIRYLSSYPHTSGCHVLGRSRSGSIVRVGISAKEGRCPLSLVVKDFSMGANLGSVERVDFEGRIHWRIEAKGTHRIERLQQALQSKFEVQDFQAKRLSNTPSMTKSSFLLKEAFERGYFDVPKRLSIEELSHDLGIPLSTLDIDIRRALKVVLTESTC